MIKLKRLIIENQIKNQSAFKIPGDTTWEYKIDNNKYYTKKQVDTAWLDMKKSLSAANYTKAVNVIDTYLNSKNQNDKKQQDTPKNQEKNTIDKNEEFRLLTLFKSQINIMDYLKNQLTDNPADFFKKFKSKINDKELELYYWWYKDTYTYFKKNIAKQRNTAYDPILKSNFDIIEQCLDIIAKQFKAGGDDWSFTTELQDPVTKKSKSYKIVWNYLKY